MQNYDFISNYRHRHAMIVVSLLCLLIGCGTGSPPNAQRLELGPFTATSGLSKRSYVKESIAFRADGKYVDVALHIMHELYGNGWGRIGDVSFVDAIDGGDMWGGIFSRDAYLLKVVCYEMIAYDYEVTPPRYIDETIYVVFSLIRGSDFRSIIEVNSHRDSWATLSRMSQDFNDDVGSVEFNRELLVDVEIGLLLDLYTSGAFRNISENL